MSSVPTRAQIWTDARWLAQALDPAAGRVRLIEMDAEAYRSASFLDDRMLQAPVNGHVVPWQAIGEPPEHARRDARWIFHIGHVGSTLVARLLGELPTVLSVREPRLLRDLVPVAPAERQAFARIATALFSRSFAPGQAALVKATSFVSEIAPELVSPHARALFLFVGPRAYIQTILAGENSIQELQALAPTRAQRLQSRVPQAPQPATLADLAALAWACEITALESAAQAIGEGAVLWADFDALLADLDTGMERTASFLAIDATVEQLRAINAGPLLRRYSKATEYEYGPELRRALLEEAEAGHRRDIDKAVDLLHKAARSSPLLERALARSAPES